MCHAEVSDFLNEAIAKPVLKYFATIFMCKTFLFMHFPTVKLLHYATVALSPICVGVLNCVFTDYFERALNICTHAVVFGERISRQTPGKAQIVSGT